MVYIWISPMSTWEALMLHSKAKLRSDFEGASILLLEDAVVELDEGHRHKGPAAVVRAIVRKPI